MTDRHLSKECVDIANEVFKEDVVTNPYKGIYLEAFERGVDYAYGNDDYEFGEETQEEEYKNIPSGCDKEKYLEAWHHGYGIGCGDGCEDD